MINKNVYDQSKISEKTTKIINELEKRATENPKLFSIQHKLANIYMNHNLLDKAFEVLKHIDNVFDLDQRDKCSYLKLKSSYHDKLGEHNSALKYYLESIELEPNEKSWGHFAILGELYQKNGNHLEAIRAFKESIEKAIDSKSDYPITYVKCSDSMLGANQVDEALNFILLAKRNRFPKNSVIDAQIAKCYILKREVKKAKHILEEIKKTAPKTADNLYKYIAENESIVYNMIYKMDNKMQRLFAKEWVIILSTITVSLIVAFIVSENDYYNDFQGLWLPYLLIGIGMVEITRTLIWSMKILKRKKT